MKLSKLKNNGVSKKLQFNDGGIKLWEASENLSGEINFYEIDVAKLASINKEVILKLTVTDTNELFMFHLIPHISDMEIDITYEQYLEMMKSPNAHFTAFMNQVVIAVGEIFELLDSLKNTKTNSETVTKSINEKVGTVEVFEENMRVIVEKDTEDKKELQLERLYEQLASARDKEERKSLITQISDLEKELG